jgi:hypothetical protein
MFNPPMQTKQLLYAILLAAALWPGSLHSAPPSTYSKEFWQAQIKKLHLGMQRWNVEEYLPARSLQQEKWSRNNYTTTYALDQSWSVSATYDMSGFSPVNNPHNDLHLFNDKLIKYPHLFKHSNVVGLPGFPWTKPK